MRVIQALDDFVPPSFAVVTSGTFDGVHKGHRKILERVINIAKDNHGQSVVLTYWPHPRFVINKDNATELRLLSTFEEKCQLLQEVGIDILIKLPFTRAFSELSSHDFITDILVNKIGTQKLVIGYNHRFGKNREGGFDYLMANASRYGFSVEEIPKLDVDNMGVSSTKIRDALKNGDVSNANSFLGSPYSLSGIIIAGDKVGRKMGFPTANIQLTEPLKLIPSDGVYAVLVTLEDKQHKGMMNIGLRPTLLGKKKTLEVNIFDFDEDIYGRKVTVQFIKRLRNEMKFKNVEALADQLKLDEKQARQVLAAY